MPPKGSSSIIREQNSTLRISRRVSTGLGGERRFAEPSHNAVAKLVSRRAIMTFTAAGTQNVDLWSPVWIRNKNDREDDVSLDASDFDQAVEKYHLALDEFMKGNPAPAEKLFSQRDDVTLGNPFGPFAHGWKQVVETMEQAASNYRDGDATGFENIAKCVTSELAYIVEVEQLRSKVGGRSDVTPLALRATSVFRPEDGLWKIVHRHADPITTAQPADSVLHR